MSNSVGRIPVAFRVGITGHRKLDRPDEVAADVGIALERILAHQSVPGTNATPVELTIVSALAEGADRILIDQVRAAGRTFRLEAVLPMPAEQYVDDFKTPQSRDVFDEMLKSATTKVIAGSSAMPEASYMAAGRAIVDRSDVLMAVWDGMGSNGSGGTADVVAYAEERGTPLIWVHVDGTNRITPNWGDKQTFSPLRPMPVSPAAFRELDRFNRRTLRREVSAARSALLPPSIDAGDASRLTPLVDDWAAPYFGRAEELASRSQLSSLYAAIFLPAFAATAVWIVAGQLAFKLPMAWTWLEVGVLFAISVVLVLLRTLPSMQLHDRWLSTRWLAERIRSAVFLAAAGVGEEGELGAKIGAEPGVNDEWLARAVKEMWLRRPPTSIDTTGFGPVQYLLVEVWMAGQVRYHAKTAAANHRRHGLLHTVVLVLFGISVVVAVLHVLDAYPPLSEWFTFSAIAIPAAAAAISGFGAQREYGQLADRSRRMVVQLTETSQQMQKVDSIETLRHLALIAEQQLRGEAADWYSLVHIHKPDVPA